MRNYLRKIVIGWMSNWKKRDFLEIRSRDWVCGRRNRCGQPAAGGKEVGEGAEGRGCAAASHSHPNNSEFKSKSSVEWRAWSCAVASAAEVEREWEWRGRRRCSCWPPACWVWCAPTRTPPSTRSPPAAPTTTSATTEVLHPIFSPTFILLQFEARI